MRSLAFALAIGAAALLWGGGAEAINRMPYHMSRAASGGPRVMAVASASNSGRWTRKSLNAGWARTLAARGLAAKASKASWFSNR